MISGDIPPSMARSKVTGCLRDRRGQGHSFREPIRFSWVALAAWLPDSCPTVAMAARFVRNGCRRKARWGVAEIGWSAGLEERSARRTLQTLSEASLISLTREPSYKPGLTILELEEPKRRFDPL
jgi:hypothetical protein